MVRLYPVRESWDLRARLATTTVLRTALSPLIYAKYREGLPTKLSVGTPSDEPHGMFAGPDPDRRRHPGRRRALTHGSDQCRAGGSETGATSSPCGVRTHQHPVLRRSARVLNR